MIVVSSQDTTRVGKRYCRLCRFMPRAKTKPVLVDPAVWFWHRIGGSNGNRPVYGVILSTAGNIGGEPTWLLWRHTVDEASLIRFNLMKYDVTGWQQGLKMHLDRGMLRTQKQGVGFVRCGCCGYIH